MSHHDLVCLPPALTAAAALRSLVLNGNKHFSLSPDDVSTLGRMGQLTELLLGDTAVDELPPGQYLAGVHLLLRRWLQVAHVL
jgi:hypothetical protein